MKNLKKKLDKVESLNEAKNSNKIEKNKQIKKNF